MPFEASVSYVQRLADTYGLSTVQLLDGLNINHTGQPGTAPAVELRLNTLAVWHLAAWARIPPHHRTGALGQGAAPATDRPAQRANNTPYARWHPTDPALRPLRACTSCVLARSHGTTATAWAHLPEHRLVCVKHVQASSDHRLPGTLNIRGLPELVRAHQQHQRLRHRPEAGTAYTWARAVTTRWYDHQHHCARRWNKRLKRLTLANQHLPSHDGTASLTLLARRIITYPETVILARALTHIPGHGLPHTQHAVYLQHLAQQLELERLAPIPGDLLFTRLTPGPHRASPAA
ncbi:hypothetical protein [Streptomyces sp. NPDC002851]